MYCHKSKLLENREDSGNPQNTVIKHRIKRRNIEYRRETQNVQTTEINIENRNQHRIHRDQPRIQSSTSNTEINIEYRDQHRIQRSKQNTEINIEHKDQHRIQRFNLEDRDKHRIQR